jgi:hypothetical protein
MPLIFLALLFVFTTSVSAQTPLAPPALFAAPGAQTPLAAASDGSSFFVIWSDTRPAAGLYGARISADGTVVDRVGLPIVYGSITHATVLWDGSAWVILWEDADGIRERHMLRDGTFDPAVVLVAPGTVSTNRFAARAANGVVAIVHDAAISFTDPTGTGAGPAQPIPNATSLAVASVGNDFFVVWNDSGRTMGQHYTASGVAITDPFQVAPGSGDAPVIVAGPTQYLLLTTGSTVEARLIPVNGAPSAPIVVGSGGAAPTATAVSNGFAIAFVSGGGIVSTILTNGATTSSTLVTGSGLAPQIAWNGRDVFVAWADRTPSRDVNGLLIGRTSATRISSSAADETQSSIAFGAGVYGVAFTETQADGVTQNVVFSRVNTTGAVLDARPVPIGNPTEVNDNPVVTFDGTNFVVAFLAHRGSAQAIAISRISPAGTPLDGSSGVHVTDTCTAPAIASDKLGAAVAYAECGQGTVRVLRVSGPDAGRSVQVSVPGSHPARPQIASNGDEFLVSWQLDTIIVAARVSSSLQLLDTTPLVVTTAGQNATVGVSGTGFVVAWESIGHVWLRHINAAGNFTSPAFAIGVGSSPHLTTDGDQYAVTFLREGAAYLAHDAGDEHTLAPSANSVAFVNTSQGQATVFTNIVRDLTAGGVSRAFIVVSGGTPAPTRHRAVRK